jgi:hypothetical protein
VDREQQPSKQTAEEKPETGGDRRLALLVIGAGLAVLIIGICGYVFGWKWTGLTESEQRGFWDWLDLLIIPAVLALGGYLFTRATNRRAQDIAKQQRDVDREIADQRMKQDRKIAQERAETDRQIADQHGQDDILQLYLDQIGQLLLDRDRPLRQSKFVVSGDTEGNEMNALARARTLTVLPRLDGDRKARVVQFLMEAGLLRKEELVVSLYGSDLSGANLSGACLIGAHLVEADLRKADLSRAVLSRAKLHRSDLREADLSGAKGWTEEQLAEAKFLNGATMPNGQKYEEWLKSKGSGEDGENPDST